MESSQLNNGILNSLSEDELKLIVDNIGPNLLVLGRKLNLTETQLEQLREEREDLSEKAFKLIKWWTHKKGQTATKSVLVDALRYIGRNDIADLITNKISMGKGCLTEIAKLQKILAEKYSCFSIPQPPRIHKDIHINNMFIDQDMEKYNKEMPLGSDHILHIENLFQPVENGRQMTRILVEGDPGYGKTTLAVKLATDWAKGREYICSLFHLVMLISLRQVKTEKIEEFITEIIKRALKTTSFKFKHLKKFIAENKMLLILDGFDEISTEGREHLRSILKNKKDFKNCILVTSRRGVFTTRETSNYSTSMVHFKKAEEDIGYEFCDIHVQLKGLTKIQRNQFLQQHFNIDPDTMETLQYELFSGDKDEIFRCPLILFWLGWMMEKKEVINIKTNTMFYKSLFNFILHKTLVRLEKIEESNRFDIFRASTDEFTKSIQEDMCEFGTLALDRLIRHDLSPFTSDEISFSSESILFVSDIFIKIKCMNNKEEEILYQPMHKTFLEFLAAFSVCYSPSDTTNLSKFKRTIADIVEKKLVPSAHSLFYPFVAGLMEDKAYWLFESLSSWAPIYHVCKIGITTILKELTQINDDLMQSILKFVPKYYIISTVNSCVRNFYSTDVHKRLLDKSLQEKMTSIIWCGNFQALHQHSFASSRLERLYLVPTATNNQYSSSTSLIIQCHELVHLLDDSCCTSWSSCLEMQKFIDADLHILHLCECQSKSCTMIFKEMEQGNWSHLSFQRVILMHCALENGHLESLVQLINANRITKGISLSISSQHKLTADAIQRLWETITESSSIDEFHFYNNDSNFVPVFDLTLTFDSNRKRPFEMLAFHNYFSIKLGPSNFNVQSILELTFSNIVNEPTIPEYLLNVGQVKCLHCSYALLSLALAQKIPVLTSLEELYLHNNGLAFPDSFTGWEQIKSLQSLNFNLNYLDSIPSALHEFMVTMLADQKLQILAFHDIHCSAVMSSITEILSEIKQSMRVESLELIFEGEWAANLLPNDLLHVKSLLKHNQIRNLAIVDYYSCNPLRSVLPSLFPKEEFRFEVEIFGTKPNHSIWMKQCFNRLMNFGDLICIYSKTDTGKLAKSSPVSANNSHFPSKNSLCSWNQKLENLLNQRKKVLSRAKLNF